MRHGYRLFLLPAIVLLLSACSSTPDYPPRADTRAQQTIAGKGHPGVRIAQTLLGTPYHYGGSSPRGFDCSGLVYYSYRKAGIDVPRTTRAQMSAASHVRLSRLSPGDLLFFRTSGRGVSHVAIYAGNRRFIHAPSSGKRVSYGSMNDAYWKNRLIAAGRF